MDIPIARKGGTRGPRSVICYICGRQYMVHSFEIHEKQCRELFLKREELKPPKERRVCPQNPMLGFSGLNGAIKASGGRSYDEMIETVNNAAMQSYSSTLLPCQYCGRKFLPDKLPIHNRSCRADNPARRVDEPVNRGGGISNSFPTEYEESLHTRSVRSSGLAQPAAANRRESTFRSTTGAMSAAAAYDDSGGYDLRQCPDCGRKFNGVAYGKHVRICKKVFCQKRRPFDSFKHRAQGTDLAVFLKSNGWRKGKGASASTTSASALLSRQQSLTSSRPPAVGGMPKWKRDSLEFRRAMRAARAYAAEKRSQGGSGSGGSVNVAARRSVGGNGISAARAVRGGITRLTGSSKALEGQAAPSRRPLGSSSFSSGAFGSRGETTAAAAAAVTATAANVAGISFASGGGVGYGNRHGSVSFAPSGRQRQDSLVSGSAVQVQRSSATKKQPNRRSASSYDAAPDYSYDDLGVDLGPDPSYIQCPTCGRSFNEAAGSRHIPQCKSIIAKPKVLHKGSGAPSYSTRGFQSPSDWRN